MTKYLDVEITREGQLATITILPTGEARVKRHGEKSYPRIHAEVGEAILELRGDNSVRVIVLTGRSATLLVPSPHSPWYEAREPGLDWDVTQGMAKTLEAFIDTEKPIIAKVNGPAVSFGSSMVFACDFIVAREDAVLVDHHLAMGELKGWRDDFGTVPGDGGCVFVPMYMSPALAKEYLLLAKPMTGAELAKLGVINYAVPANKLDETVNEMAQRLLKRTPYALAWAKRVINRRIRQNFDLTFDAAWAYELVNFYMAQPQSREKGGERGVSTL